MTTEDLAKPTQANFPRLIVLVGVCLLSAAYGPRISDHNRTLWGCFGLFGIVAGVGLDQIRKHHETVRKERDSLDTQLRCIWQLQKMLHKEDRDPWAAVQHLSPKAEPPPIHEPGVFSTTS